ncbi:hypothetical protein EIP86_003535 [Pleurotus ostreatoroseus]|nr:hypothetical protein EIP86_003535 [Pleurotus ostreatoroseus]
MENIIQQLLAPTAYKYINPWREFTLLLLPLLSRKLRRTIPALLPHPPILAHTIYQALTFDSALRDEGFDLAGTSATSKAKEKDGKEVKKWEGISEVILGKKEWFEAWMEGERAFATEQYIEIISAPDAWLIAEDSGEEEDESPIDRELKPTNSARRVKALVEQVTDRYSPLPQFVQRTRFLIVVQLPLLEQYHARIAASLDAFETLSSSLLRAVPGALADAGRTDSKRLTSGVEGVQRLCKALVSAKYLAAAMEAWGEDVFFLELWTEINHRAALRTHAEVTSSLPDPRGGPDDVPDGTIFEELVVQYGRLASRAEDMIVHTIYGEVEAGLKAHFSAGGSAQTTPEQSSSTDEAVALPSTLLAPFALLSSQLTLLQSTLPQTTVRSLYTRTASHLAQHILQRAIMYRGRARISPAEGRALRAECELWAETSRVALARMAGRSEAPWRPLLQAARVVGAQGEEWTRVVDATLGPTTDEEWERVMVDVVGFAELGREEVSQVILTRMDSGR